MTRPCRGWYPLDKRSLRDKAQESPYPLHIRTLLGTPHMRMPLQWAHTFLPSMARVQRCQERKTIPRDMPGSELHPRLDKNNHASRVCSA